jgi:hypothetical protein
VPGPLWSKPCLAYNLHAELDDACRVDLVQGQERLRLPGTWALRCPPVALHVSVVTILSLTEGYGNLPKPPEPKPGPTAVGDNARVNH